MPRIRCVWWISSVLAIVLVSCAPAQASPAAPDPSPQSIRPQATPPPASEPLGAAIPAIQFRDGGNRLVLVSSTSGKVLDESPAIPFGEFYNYAFAPDGRTLAFVSASQLYLIDLSSWTSHRVDIELHGPMTAVVYSRDGSLLAIASADPDAALRLVDAASGTVIVSAQAGFAVHNLRFTQDGKGLMLYGPRLADKGREANLGVSIGAPRIALLSTSDLKILWSAELSGLRDGTFLKQADTPDIYQPGVASHFAPAIAFASGADILYAVHGDQERLTVVDFAARRIATRDIRAQTGLLDRLLAWTAGVAHAKGMDGTTKQAVTSPDGRFLYVVGSTEAVTQLAGKNNWDFTVTPIGLDVISVPDATLVQKLDTQASAVVLAPDGTHLLLQGWDQNSAYGAWTDVYDISSRRLIAHLPGLQLQPVRRVDGALGLRSSVMVSGLECDMAAVDAGTWKVIARWKDSICSNWLTAP